MSKNNNGGYIIHSITLVYLPLPWHAFPGTCLIISYKGFFLFLFIYYSDYLSKDSLTPRVSCMCDYKVAEEATFSWISVSLFFCLVCSQVIQQILFVVYFHFLPLHPLLLSIGANWYIMQSVEEVKLSTGKNTVNSNCSCTVWPTCLLGYWLVQ